MGCFGAVPPFARAAADDWWYSKLVNPGHHAVFWAAHEQQAQARNQPHALSAEAKQLLQSMLCANPAARISVPDILADAFTSGQRHECVRISQQLCHVLTFLMLGRRFRNFTFG